MELVELLLNPLVVLFSICSPMGITGDGLMTARAVGAVIVHQTTVRLMQRGERGRAVSASQLDAEDTQCSLTQWCRYAQDLSVTQYNSWSIVFLVEFSWFYFIKCTFSGR